MNCISGFSRLFLGLLIMLSPALSFSDNTNPSSGPSGKFKGPGYSPKKNGPSGMRPVVLGRLSSLEGNTLTIILDNGDEKRLQTTPRTRFVKNIPTDPASLKIGQQVRIRGGYSSRETFNAMSVTILSAKGLDSPFGHGKPPGPYPDGKQGDFEPPRPLTGTIGSLDNDHFTLQEQDGLQVEFGSRTRFTKEMPITLSDLVIGEQVVVIAPPKPGSDTREILLVAAGPESQQSPFIEKTDPVQTSFKKELFPDLPQAALDPDFIYGVWLGRGLFSNSELDRAFKVASNLGLRYLKVEVKWDYVEPVNNQFQWDNQATLNLEYVISLARAHSMSIIPYFNMAMPWGKRRFIDPGKGECEGPHIPTRGQFLAPDPDEYADYVFQVVKKLIHAGVIVRFIELDNEISNGNDGFKSTNCHVFMTARELKLAQNAAYIKVKSTFPEVSISSTTFSFPGMSIHNQQAAKLFNITRESFLKAYFEEDPKPLFDFLGIHEVISGSGNPYTTHTRSPDDPATVDFISYHNAYDLWRTLLDHYGYNEKPILNLESGSVATGMQSAVLMQRAVFARTNMEKNNVRAWILSQLSGSKRFTAGRGSDKPKITVGITRLQDELQVGEGYNGLYLLLRTLPLYAFYDGCIQGELNADSPWVEAFSNTQGNRLYIAFLPYRVVGWPTDRSFPLSLNIGSGKEALITDIHSLETRNIPSHDGVIKVEVTQTPIMIEVKN